MAFTSENGRIAGQKSKRGKAKKFEPNIKEKMELLYEEVLDHLIMYQDELSNSDRVRLVQSLSNYLLPKPNRCVINTHWNGLKKEIRKA